jgi:hypothetical protein
MRNRNQLTLAQCSSNRHGTCSYYQDTAMHLLLWALLLIVVLPAT